MTKAHALKLARAGDIIVTILGYTLARMERGEDYTERQLEEARRAIATWHRLRAEG